jgi:YfiR/HmsC-like
MAARWRLQRYESIDQVDTCHILFIDRSEAGQLDAVFAAVKARSILTVGDFAGFTQRGDIIRFVTVANKIRLRVNLAAAQQPKLTISSKLLRPAQIVASGDD